MSCYNLITIFGCSRPCVMRQTTNGVVYAISDWFKNDITLSARSNTSSYCELAYPLQQCVIFATKRNRWSLCGMMAGSRLFARLKNLRLKIGVSFYIFFSFKKVLRYLVFCEHRRYRTQNYDPGKYLIGLRSTLLYK